MFGSNYKLYSVLLSIFTPIPQQLDYCSFICLKIKQCKSSLSLFFFKVVLTILNSFYFQIHFRISVSISTKKKSVGLFYWNCIETIRGELTTILSLLIHEQAISSQKCLSSLAFNTFHQTYSKYILRLLRLAEIFKF